MTDKRISCALSIRASLNEPAPVAADANSPGGLRGSGQSMPGHRSQWALAAKKKRRPLKQLLCPEFHYDTTKARTTRLESYAKEVATLIMQEPIQSEHLGIPAVALFEPIKTFALFTKHKGFEEEREWRVVYIPNRDSKSILRKQFGYSIGTRGIEPRLRFSIEPTEGITAGDFSLEKIIDRIILGPTSSSPLALTAFCRLLEAAGHPELTV